MVQNPVWCKPTKTQLTTLVLMTRHWDPSSLYVYVFTVESPISLQKKQSTRVIFSRLVPASQKALPPQQFPNELVWLLQNINCWGSSGRNIARQN